MASHCYRASALCCVLSELWGTSSVASRTKFCFYELPPSRDSFCSWAIRRKRPTLSIQVLPVGVHLRFSANRSIKKTNWFEMNWVYRHVIVSVNSISDICCWAEALTAYWSGKSRHGFNRERIKEVKWGKMSNEGVKKRSGPPQHRPSITSKYLLQKMR